MFCHFNPEVLANSIKKYQQNIEPFEIYFNRRFLEEHKTFINNIKISYKYLLAYTYLRENMRPKIEKEYKDKYGIYNYNLYKNTNKNMFNNIKMTINESVESNTSNSEKDTTTDTNISEQFEYDIIQSSDYEQSKNDTNNVNNTDNIINNTQIINNDAILVLEEVKTNLSNEDDYKSIKTLRRSKRLMEKKNN